jgi:hypothetical protein
MKIKEKIKITALLDTGTDINIITVKIADATNLSILEIIPLKAETFTDYNCWVHRGDHRILALRHKILSLMIEGLAKRGGAEVSSPSYDALIRSAATSTDLPNLFIFYLYLSLPCMSG